MPRITASICTYNREQSLCDVLGDLFAQEFRDFEIIVVDQTAVHTPATQEFLARHVGQFRHIREPVANLPAAKNIALHAAEGDVLMLIDDDLRLEPGLLGEVAAFFDDPSVMAMAPRVVPDPDEPLWEPEPPRFRRRVDPDAPRRMRYCIGAGMAVRRRHALAVGGFDAVMGRLHNNAAVEDIEFSRRVARAGALWYVPRITVRHMSGVAGGCEFRTGPHAYEMAPHTRGGVYMVLKEEGALERMNVRALARMARLTAIRRDVLLAGPAAVVRGLARIRPLVSEVRELVQEATVSDVRGPVESVDDRAPL